MIELTRRHRVAGLHHRNTRPSVSARREARRDARLCTMHTARLRLSTRLNTGAMGRLLQAAGALIVAVLVSLALMTRVNLPDHMLGKTVRICAPSWG